MAKKIETLTPAQERHLVAYRDEWLAKGRSTQPADRKTAERVFGEMYAALGLPAPQVWWFGGPATAAIFRTIAPKLQGFGANLRDNLWANLRANLWDNLGANLRDNLGANLRDNLWANLGDNLRDNLRDNLWANLGDNLRANLGDNLRDNLGDNLWANLSFGFWGQHESHWPAYFAWPHVALRSMHSAEQARQLAWWTDLASAIGWWNPFSGIVVACERPAVQAVDEDGRLHREDGPALLCRDGWPVWAIHGVMLDEQIVMRPETQTVQEIDADANEDRRAVRIARFGWPRYLQESGARRVDSRKNEIEGTRECLMATSRGERRLLVTCPTGRVFALGVPNDIATCVQAQRWLANDVDGRTRVIART